MGGELTSILHIISGNIANNEWWKTIHQLLSCEWLEKFFLIVVLTLQVSTLFFFFVFLFVFIFCGKKHNMKTDYFQLKYIIAHNWMSFKWYMYTQIDY